MAPSDIVLFKSAIETTAGITHAIGRVLDAMKDGKLVREEDRARLARHREALRASDIMSIMSRLNLQAFNEVAEYMDVAERSSSSPLQYRHALERAQFLSATLNRVLRDTERRLNAV